VGCIHTPNNAPCEDGSVCNGHEACVHGACRHSAPLDCDDDNPCTDDCCEAVRAASTRRFRTVCQRRLAELGLEHQRRSGASGRRHRSRRDGRHREGELLRRDPGRLRSHRGIRTPTTRSPATGSTRGRSARAS
jgi:hypothetical protein